MLYFRKGQYLKGRFPWQEMNRPFLHTLNPIFPWILLPDML